MPNPTLSIIVPNRRLDASDFRRFSASLKQQTFRDYEVCLETGTEPEEQKARAALRAKGEILGFFCSDNELRNPHFLEVMVRYAQDPNVTGAYPARYDYVKEDTALSRYFALLGNNDPVCWWLGKSDRESYFLSRFSSSGSETSETGARIVSHRNSMPSCGDNGFFIKRAIFFQQAFTPQTFGSCMCSCERLRRLGHATYWVVEEQTLWHRTGDKFWDYFRRRYRYVNHLYFHHVRDWRMVATRRDWVLVVAFGFASLLVVPHLWTSLRGYRRVPDWCWLLHPVVCLLLTLAYAWAFTQHVISRSELDALS